MPKDELKDSVENVRNGTFFLPDFCHGRTTLAIILITELVAIVMALGQQAQSNHFWLDLAGASMFLLWVGLGCAMALCRATPKMKSSSTHVAVMIALVAICSVVAVVSEVTYQLGQYFTGGLPSLLSFPERHAQFILRNMVIGLIVGGLALRYFYVSHEWKRSIELEAQARIHALHARIRPHFLFNSMNTIAALTRRNPRQAEEAVQDLADLFRASLSDAHKQISLEDEIEVAKVYERIEALRLGNRLRVHWRVDDVPMDAQVPCLLLQPLLENAIYHGIEPLPDGGDVKIDGVFRDSMIEIRIANPVKAPPHGELVASQIAVESRKGHQLAMNNIRQRLQLAWPDSLRRPDMSIESTADTFIVTLRFPYQGAQRQKVAAK